MTTVFDSVDGGTYAVIEMGHCQRHGDFPQVVARVWDDGTMSPSSRTIGCPACRREAQERALFGDICIPRRFHGKSLDTFEVNDQNRNVVDFFRDYEEHVAERVADGTCIVLTGRPGTGKTHLACALLLAAQKKGMSSMFTSVARLVRSVRDTWGCGSKLSESQVIANFVNLDLLAIDEVGVQAKSDNERNILFAVINGRYEEMKPTIILSNETVSEVKQILGERAFDRLREGGGRAFSLSWESFRPKAKHEEIRSEQTAFKFYEMEIKEPDESYDKPF